MSLKVVWVIASLCSTFELISTLIMHKLKPHVFLLFFSLKWSINCFTTRKQIKKGLIKKNQNTIRLILTMQKSLSMISNKNSNSYCDLSSLSQVIKSHWWFRFMQLIYKHLLKYLQTCIEVSKGILLKGIIKIERAQIMAPGAGGSGRGECSAAGVQDLRIPGLISPAPSSGR